MKRFAFVSSLVFAAAAGLAACAGSAPPVAGPVAADNGQPKMQAALGALQQAESELEAATADKGGFRVKAIESVKAAIAEVNEGMAYAAAHADEVGEAEGAAEPEAVDGEVPGAANQPHMGQAIVDLREARRQLKEARRDKGGHRKNAMAAIQAAIDATKQGIAFANEH